MDDYLGSDSFACFAVASQVDSPLKYVDQDHNATRIIAHVIQYQYKQNCIP